MSAEQGIRNRSFLIVTPQSLADSMKPKTPDTVPQDDLFRHRLDNIISLQHPLARLGERVGWEGKNLLLGEYYEEAAGASDEPSTEADLHSLG